MAALDVLKKYGIVNWPVLVVGMENGWSKKHDLIQFAQDWIERNDMVDEDVVAIALGESLSMGDLVLHVFRYLKSCGEEDSEVARAEARNRWRFGFLTALLESDQSEEKKVFELQELYGEFGFPDDMESCSIYSNDGTDPLNEARIVADRLERNNWGQEKDV